MLIEHSHKVRWWLTGFFWGFELHEPQHCIRAGLQLFSTLLQPAEALRPLQGFLKGNNDYTTVDIWMGLAFKTVKDWQNQYTWTKCLSTTNSWQQSLPAYSWSHVFFDWVSSRTVCNYLLRRSAEGWMPSREIVKEFGRCPSVSRSPSSRAGILETLQFVSWLSVNCLLR